MKHKLQTLLKHNWRTLLLLLTLTTVSQVGLGNNNFDSRGMYYFLKPNDWGDNVYMITGNNAGNCCKAYKMSNASGSNLFVCYNDFSDADGYFFADNACSVSTTYNSCTNRDIDNVVKTGNYTTIFTQNKANKAYNPSTSTWTDVNISNEVLKGSLIMFYIGEPTSWNQGTFYIRTNNGPISISSGSETVNSTKYGYVAAPKNTGYIITHTMSNWDGKSITSGHPVQGGAYWVNNDGCNVQNGKMTSTLTLANTSITAGNNVAISSNPVPSGGLKTFSTKKYYATTDGQSFTELSTQDNGATLVTRSLAAGSWTIWPMYGDGNIFCRGNKASLTINTACSAPSAPTVAAPTSVCSGTAPTFTVTNAETTNKYKLCFTDGTDASTASTPVSSGYHYVTASSTISEATNYYVLATAICNDGYTARTPAAGASPSYYSVSVIAPALETETAPEFSRELITHGTETKSFSVDKVCSPAGDFVLKIWDGTNSETESFTSYNGFTLSNVDTSSDPITFKVSFDYAVLGTRTAQLKITYNSGASSWTNNLSAETYCNEPAAANFTYTSSRDYNNGTASGAAVAWATGTGSGQITTYYKVKGANDNTYTTEIPLNAGTYTVAVTAVAGGAYCVTSDKIVLGDYTINKIDQASYSITSPAASSEYCYGSTPVTVVAEGGSDTGNNTVYSITGGTGTGTIDPATGVLSVTASGTFTVTASKAGGTNYNDASASVTFTVKGAIVTQSPTTVHPYEPVTFTADNSCAWSVTPLPEGVSTDDAYLSTTSGTSTVFKGKVATGYAINAVYDGCATVTNFNVVADPNNCD